MTTVVNKRNAAFDVYIGRGSEWGNPFRIGPDGDRAAVIRKYRQWLYQRPNLVERAQELKGKRLGCFCAPLACHGDVLVGLLEGGEDPPFSGCSDREMEAALASWEGIVWQERRAGVAG